MAAKLFQKIFQLNSYSLNPPAFYWLWWRWWGSSNGAEGSGGSTGPYTGLTSQVLITDKNSKDIMEDAYRGGTGRLLDECVRG